MREKDYPQKHQHPVLDAAVERSEAKFLSRYAVPVLVFLLLTVSGVAYRLMLDRLDVLARNDDQRSRDVTQIKSDLKVLTTRLDAAVIAQVNENSKKLDDHEQRLRDLERAENVLRAPPHK